MLSTFRWSRCHIERCRKRFKMHFSGIVYQAGVDEHLGMIGEPSRSSAQQQTSASTDLDVNQEELDSKRLRTLGTLVVSIGSTTFLYHSEVLRLC